METMINIRIVASFVNADLGLEGRVLMIQGKYNVILRDTDADAPVGLVTKFTDRKKAEAYAKLIANVEEKS
jgi:MinD superfamily P-loop ATPase